MMKKTSRKRTISVVSMTVALLVGFAVGIPALASGAPAQSGGPTTEQLDNQQALSDLRTWLIDQPSYKDGEFVSATDDLDKKSMTVLWYGNSPFLQEFIAEGIRRGISVSVDSSVFSAPQFQAAASTVLSGQFELDSTAGGLEPQTVVGDDPGFKGLIVRVAYKDGGLKEGRQASAAQLDSVAQQVAKATGYPTKAVMSDVAHAATTRDTDTPQMNSGGLMIYGSSICSNGFAISLYGGTYTGTARHCAAVTYYDRDDPSNFYGYTEFIDAGTQWRVLSQSGYFWMFDGNYATSNHKTVNAYGDLAVNDWVFSSGGNSGTHPNLRVTSLTANWNDGYGSAWEIEAHAPNNTIAAMAGDSGGPMFTYHTDNLTVGAAGMIQYYFGGTTGGACGTARDPNPCGSSVGFTSAHSFVNDIPGASLYIG